MIAIAFLFGVVTTVYLSLRSPEVKVPDVVGKDRFEAEKILAKIEALKDALERDREKVVRRERRKSKGP